MCVSPPTYRPADFRARWAALLDSGASRQASNIWMAASLQFSSRPLPFVAGCHQEPSANWKIQQLELRCDWCPHFSLAICDAPECEIHKAATVTFFFFILAPPRKGGSCSILHGDGVSIFPTRSGTRPTEGWLPQIVPIVKQPRHALLSYQ